ncbi:sialidase family protein [Salidesulfovibrio onnuriiensis]|uniref:sialidase family protein n=1 Tax=Salidesulfovibrio onnuriiensis TaxID=2583823 RepID=UPI0011CA6D0D|nr:sialidase family protein [Salidesulfovibrio onnuriiensis]
MPSISDNAKRHVVIDRRARHYLCFPDICATPSGRLIVAYNEYDQHVGNRRFLLTKHSDDNGATWSEPRIVRSERSHCPRLTRLGDGHILLLEDMHKAALWSSDNGNNWAEVKTSGIQHGLIDRVLEIDAETLLTAAHSHRGTHAHPAIRQAPAEQMVYISENRGQVWKPLSVMANDRNLVLCEASMCRLEDGRIIALLRENSFVYEPMYLCVSSDNGNTWSDPRPTPLIGHRPTLGLTPSGKLLVTYRDVGPDRGTAAWLGSLEELDDFRVHGHAPGAPSLTEEGLRVVSGPGAEEVVRYALRPLTDPRHATAEMEVEVRVDLAGENGCGLRFAGLWWMLFPDRIVPRPAREDMESPEGVPLPEGRFNVIRLAYDRGRCSLLVNGEERLALDVPGDDAETRPILFGAPYPFEDNAVDCTWKRVRLQTEEPGYHRKYSWSWQSEDGLPDQWKRDHVLELKNDRDANPGDFGYSGWVSLPDGRLLCAYHHGGSDEEGYQPGKSARILGTFFSEEDFA